MTVEKSYKPKNQNSNMQKGHWLFIILISLIGIVCFAIYLNYQQHKSDTLVIEAREAVLQTMGISSLAISYECSTTRNPAIEGLCSSMSDIPGSYLYHSDCDIVSPPRFSQAEIYRLEIH